MNFFNLLTLLGGLAFFLYGMTVMSNGLEKMTGGKLERALRSMTSNPLKGIALGAGITIAIQSSSAMTVMLVGFVNSGIMELKQTVSVIMGSNIGTTLTAWLLSLTGVGDDNFFVSLLKPSSFSPVIALVGILMIMLSKSTKKKDIGNIMLGFAILMYGMDLMGAAVEPLKDMPEFTKILTHFNNPILGVATGAIFTGIIQSSAASVGILIALSGTGLISYGMAMPVIFGQNIGTCVTALLSSIGVNRNAKRVAIIHISFNMIGTVVWLTVFYLLNYFIGFAFVKLPINEVGIAAIHSIFNLCTTLLLLPFMKQLEKLSRWVIKDKKNEKELANEIAFIDQRLLATPSVAIGECDSKVKEMAKVAQSSIKKAIHLLSDYSAEEYEQIKNSEEQIDHYEDILGTYLIQLSGKELTDRDSQKINNLLHVIGDFERLGDHAVNILELAQEIFKKQLVFSDQAKEELKVMTDAVLEILDNTIESFQKDDIKMAKEIEPLEQVIDELEEKLKNRHIKRLQDGACSITQGFVFVDLLSNFERVSDHCSNIAVSMIQTQSSSYEVHEYLHSITTLENKHFIQTREQYSKKYMI